MRFRSRGQIAVALAGSAFPDRPLLLDRLSVLSQTGEMFSCSLGNRRSSRRTCRTLCTCQYFPHCSAMALAMPGNVLLRAFALSFGGNFIVSICQGLSVPLPFW